MQNYFLPSCSPVLEYPLTYYLLQAFHFHNKQLVKRYLQEKRNPFWNVSAASMVSV